MEFTQIDTAQAVRMFCDPRAVREALGAFVSAREIEPGRVTEKVERLLAQLPEDPLHRLHAIDVAAQFYRTELAKHRARYEALREYGVRAVADEDLRLSAVVERTPTEAAVQALCQALSQKGAEIGLCLAMLEGLEAAAQTCGGAPDFA